IFCSKKLEDQNSTRSRRSLAEKSISGRHFIASIYDAFLRIKNAKGIEVDLSPQAKENNLCWRWFIEEYNNKIMFKPFCMQGAYIFASSIGFVGLTFERKGHLFLPIYNDDGSWSFLSESGNYLNADNKGFVSTVKDQTSSTHFRLSPWEEIACCDCPAEFDIVNGKCGGFYTTV
ncbi:hypothetical protein PMAYCL1PPCAC_33261, partial [Pristionchus mayeri]